VWQFGTGNRKWRSCARVYPGWENKVVLTIQPLGPLATYIARRAWEPFKAPLKPGNCLPLVAQHLVPEKGAGKKATGKKGEKNRRRLLFHRHRPQGRGEGAVWSARRGQQALASCCLGIHRVSKIKNETRPLYLRHGGFFRGDACGQAGGKARNTEA
jgi:hypothetical protein